jgi:maleate isomerase
LDPTTQSFTVSGSSAKKWVACENISEFMHFPAFYAVNHQYLIVLAGSPANQPRSIGNQTISIEQQKQLKARALIKENRIMKLTTVQHKQPLENLAPAGRIGVIALATDFNIEVDLYRLYPSDVQFFTSRVKNVNPLTIENLRTMAPGISMAADTILPGVELDAIIYACTSGTIAIGVDRIAELVHEVRPGVAVINPVTAALSAFQRFGAKRISILTPYTEAVNQEIAKFFTSQGHEVLTIAGFGFEDDTAMTYITPQDIRDAAIDCCDPDAELLFISCTALRASLVLDEIEQRLGIPVVSTNQALAWASLQLVRYPMAVNDFGALLREHLTTDRARTEPI